VRLTQDDYDSGKTSQDGIPTRNPP